MFALSTAFQSLGSSSSNTTSYYGLLSMAIEAMSYWINGSNPRVTADVEHSIQQPIFEEIEWEFDHQHLRRLTGAEGTEFQVATYTAAYQTYPGIGTAVLSDGGFVLAWPSYGQDDWGTAICAQRYDSLGAAYGFAFQVNTYTSRDQSYPAIAALFDGGYVITWASPDQDGSAWGVVARRYASSGAIYGSEFQVNTYTSSQQFLPAIATLSDGGYVISWYSYGQDGSDYGIYAQRYASSGLAYGPEFRVNTYTASDQQSPAIAALSDGGYVITWNSKGQDGSGFGIYAQRYASSSAFYGSEFRVSTYTTSDQQWPVIAALIDGGYVITWASSSQDGSGWGVYAQQYASSSVVYGSEFRVNTYTTSDQQWPAIAALPDGGYVIAWDSTGQDGSGNGIYAQRYTASGVAHGLEFQVNTYTSGDQLLPAVVALPDGGYIISWYSYGQDGTGYSVYGQRFNSNGDKIRLISTFSPTPNPTFLTTPLPSVYPTFFPTQPTFFPTLAPTLLPSVYPTLTPTAFPSFAPTPIPNTYLNLFDGVIYDVQEISSEQFIATGSVEKYGAGGKDAFLAAFNQDGSIAWSMVFGQAGEEISYSICVLKHAGNSGYLLAGSSMSTDSMTSRFLLARFSSQGTLVWTKIMNGVKTDAAYSVIETQDGNALIAGTVHSYGVGSSDGFVIKVDMDGNRLWAKTVGGVDAEGVFAIKENSAGEIFISGYTDDAGHKDVLVAKLDASGHLLWLKSVGTEKHEQANTLYLTDDGHLVIVGSKVTSETEEGLIAKLDARNGALIWAVTLADDTGDTKVLSMDSSYSDAWIISGCTTALGQNKTFIVQLTSEGEFIRIKQVNHASDGVSVIRRISSGGYVLAGSNDGRSRESFIAKMNNQLDITECRGIDDALLTYTDITANMHAANTSFGVTPVSLTLLYRSFSSQSIVMAVSNNCSSTPIKYNQKSHQWHLTSVAIIGLVAGGSVLGLLIVAGMVFYCCQQRHKDPEYTMTPVVPSDDVRAVEMTTQKAHAFIHDQTNDHHVIPVASVIPTAPPIESSSSYFFWSNSSSHQIVSEQESRQQNFAI